MDENVSKSEANERDKAGGDANFVVKGRAGGVVKLKERCPRPKPSAASLNCEGRTRCRAKDQTSICDDGDRGAPSA